LENAFGTKVTEFYCPYNKYNEKTLRIAAECGMTEIRGYRRPTHCKRRLVHARRIDFHYWNARDMMWVEKIRKVALPRVVYIIGAPRSGTTAYMRWLASKRPDSVTLKENERIWRPNVWRAERYRRLLKRSGASVVIDKNVRNSMRILDIRRQFPDAAFIHVIRDGRASANSWRNWARKTHKKDQSIEHAAQQWVEYVSYILDNRDKLPDYKEVRYEDICRDVDGFVSTNYKWQRDLSESEQKVVLDIQGPLLERLGYA
jgi:hypothetical protein